MITLITTNVLTNFQQLASISVVTVSHVIAAVIWFDAEIDISLTVISALSLLSLVNVIVITRF